LSFLKTSDVYDPERIASDLELVRRYYLRNGYADFQVVGSDTRFDPEKGGYVISVTVTEGEQYRVGSVGFDSRVGGVDPELLRGQIRTGAGDVYDAEAVEKSLNDMTTEAVRRGYAFVQVRPTGLRDPATRTVNLGYVVEEGPRVYVERVNIRGNTRTRDYVVRRELDIGEGDPYNKVLLDRGERRLNNLGYFKRVRVSTEPGTAADRVVVNIDVEDQPTGAFSIAGGYSTSDGAIGEVSVSESNFLGRGQFVRLAGQLGQRSNGIDFSFTEPYFLGYRLAAGFDVFTKFSDQTQYARYENRTTGGQLRLGLPITEEAGVILRYSLFQQELNIPNTTRKPFNDCSRPLPGFTPLNPGDTTAAYPQCAFNGEASVAVKEAQGKTLTSLAGITLAYNSVDNLKNPRNGIYAEVKPEAAGLGGDSKYFRVTGEARYYRDLFEDVVGVAKVRAVTSVRSGATPATTVCSRPAATCGWWITSSSARRWSVVSRRPASARAISRPPTRTPTRSAARPISARLWRRSSRSRSSRVTWVSRAPCSPTPAPCSATADRAPSTSTATASLTAPPARRRAALSVLPELSPTCSRNA
jgi:outer membrane protein insertion porin family